MVADGMSFGALQLGDLFLREKHGRQSHWVGALTRDGFRRALMDTSSADSIVTDSAAAATAWGIGERVDNQMIGLTPDGRTPTPILIHAQQGGKATGVVTTTRLTHATPAGFYANILTNRDDEAAIASQLVERPVDVMLGGGGKFIDPVIAGGKPGIRVVRSSAELRASDAAAPERLLGVFHADHMSFALDRPEAEPTLAEMTRVALDRLARSPDGFILQVEGGRVDHAAHYNDAGALMNDQAAFDDAIGVAIDFATARDDTLLILTTDHACANPGLTDYGPAGRRGLDRALQVRRSFLWIRAQANMHARTGGGYQPELVREIIERATGVALPEDDMATVTRWLAGDPVDPFNHANKDFAPLGSALANHFAIAFLSPNHTADFVEVTAFGPGSEALPPRVTIEALHGLMTGALDLPPARQI